MHLQEELLVLVDAVRHVAERFVKQALRGIVDDLPANLAGNPSHDFTVMDDPLVDSALQQSDGLIHVLRKAVQPRDPGLVILDRIKRHRAGERIRILNSAALVQRDVVPAESVTLDRVLVLASKQLVAGPVSGREVFRIDPVQLIQHRLVVLKAVSNCGETEILPSVAVASIAEPRGEFRVVLQFPLPLVVEELPERGGLCLVRIGCADRARQQKQHQ